MKNLVFILVVIACLQDAAGQQDTNLHRRDPLPNSFYILPKVRRNGEALPEMEIKEVDITPPHKKARSQLWRYDRLVTNVKTVYPYAVIVRERLREVNSELENIKSENERKDYIKGVEKKVFRDYEGNMRDLTAAQGKILIKLIDRETQNTSYELIKEYRGKLSAAFWQGIARICGTNLKDEYDPDGDDAIIESIVNEIEAGKI